jgi:hypothetical protein
MDLYLSLGYYKVRVHILYITLEGEYYRIREVRYKVSEVPCKVSEIRCKVRCKLLSKIRT